MEMGGKARICKIQKNIINILLDRISGKWNKPLKNLIHFGFDLSDGELQKIATSFSIIQNKIKPYLHDVGVTNPKILTNK